MGDYTAEIGGTLETGEYTVTSLDGEELESVVIPDGVTSIGNYAFYGCTSLVEFTDHTSNCTYESNCFTNCTSLTKINISDNEKWFRNTFTAESSNPLKYAKNFYINNEVVDTMKVPSDLTTIGNYVLFGWNGTTVDFGNSAIETIGSYAFKDCTNLTNCNIP